jgi:hypothetical protein
MDRDAELAFRRGLEEAGEATVRADFFSGGGLATGGEDRRELIRRWLREREEDREHRQRKSDLYSRLTFWVALGALIASVVGVIATILHQ